MQQKNHIQPKLSIVAVSRNDNHGGDLLGRMQLFISSLIEQCRLHRLQAELILVEWNPPPNRPRLAEALSWPEMDGPCRVRIIEVPAKIHRHFKNSEKLPLFQMIGKNVGIRRARGEYILSTNVDILFSEELIKFFSSGLLTPISYYRLDRYDVPAHVPLQASIEERLAYCEKNIMYVHTKEGTIVPSDNKVKKFNNDLEESATISENESRDRHSTTADGRTFMYYLKKPLEPKHLLLPFVLIRQAYYNIRNRFRVIRNKVMPPPGLHTNACGDFTLMARKNWMALRGYAELEIHPLHIDSLLCYAAFFYGLNEKILPCPMRIYHIEHTSASGWRPGEEERMQYQRLLNAGIPFLKNSDLKRRALWMQMKKGPIIFNKNPEWGLASENLRETMIA